MTKQTRFIKDYWKRKDDLRYTNYFFRESNFIRFTTRYPSYHSRKETKALGWVLSDSTFNHYQPPTGKLSMDPSSESYLKSKQVPV